MFEVAWSEIDKAGRIVFKRKSFKTSEAMQKYIERLWERDSFCELYGIREG